MVDFNEKLNTNQAEQAGIEQTEIAVVAAQPTAVAASPGYVPTFNLPVLISREEALEVIQVNLEALGGEFKFDKVKIPSGGGTSFEIVDEDGEKNPYKVLSGLVLDYYPINAWWAKEYSGEKNPPDCSSFDTITGTGSEEYGIARAQKCSTCPKNQWGSDPKGGKGKACKNIIRVFLLQEGSIIPVLLALPPSSTGNWKDYIRRLTKKMKPYYGVVTSVKLETDKNDGGIEYSKTAFGKADELTRQEAAAMKEFAASLKPAMRSVGIDSTEYVVEDVSAAGGYAETAASSASGDEPY